MKYDFDEVIDRVHDEHSFSIKWGARFARNTFGVGEMPKDVICLQISDMDYRSAPEIGEDLKKLADSCLFGYSMMNARYYDAVRLWFRERFSWDFAAEDIICTPGTHSAVARCVTKLTAPGDGVMFLTPCYNYHSDVESHGRAYVCVDMLMKDNYYTVDYEALEKACAQEKNTMLLLCNPHNPVGRVFTPAELSRIAEICRKNNVVLVSDEVHCDIVRKDVDYQPVMKVVGPRGVVACTSVSKTFNLAGLNVSNMIISDPELKKRYGYFFNWSSPFGIQGVISAYTKGGPWVEALNEYIDGALTQVIGFFREKMPRVKVRMPEASYILWLDFSAYGLTYEQLEQRFVGQKLLVSYGNEFDVHDGRQWIRLCLPSAKSVLAEACERMYKAFGDK